MSFFRGLEGTFKPIRRNKDEKGNILTYSVIHKGFETEHNTLKQAKVLAFEFKK